METKKYLYAAVGAPVTAAKTTQTRVEDLRAKIEGNLKSFNTDAQKRIDDWSKTGESTLGKLTDAKTIDDITTRVDFDQVQTQVNKLRDQLEDLVSTWRSNFRPAVDADAAKPVTGKPSAAEVPGAKPAAKKPAAQKGDSEDHSQEAGSEKAGN